MKPAETLAKRIIEGVEIGGRMVYREDQSVRTHDFDLHRTASTVAAVEATSITDGTVRSTFAAIDRNSSSLVLAAMETRAATTDNLEKPAMSGATERHLAIDVDRSATSVLMALRDLK